MFNFLRAFHNGFNFARIAVAAIAIAALVSCTASGPVYTKPNKPENELARIETRIIQTEGNSWLVRAMLRGAGFVIAVDGVPTTGGTVVGSSVVSVEPGRRELAVLWRLAVNASTTGEDLAGTLLGCSGCFASWTILSATETLNVSVEPDTIYEVVFEKKGPEVYFQMVRKQDGFPVSPRTSSKIRAEKLN